MRDSTIIKNELHAAIKVNGIHWETVERLLRELRTAEKSEQMKRRSNG